MIDDLQLLFRGDGIVPLVATLAWVSIGLLAAPFVPGAARRAQMQRSAAWTLAVVLLSVVGVLAFLVARRRQRVLLALRSEAEQPLVSETPATKDQETRLTNAKAQIVAGTAIAVVGVALSAMNGLGIIFTGAVVAGVALALRGATQLQGAFRER